MIGGRNRYRLANTDENTGQLDNLQANRIPYIQKSTAGGYHFTDLTWFMLLSVISMKVMEDREDRDYL